MKYPGRDLEVYRESEFVGQLLSMGPIGSSRALLDVSRVIDRFAVYELDVFDGYEVDLVMAYDPADTSQAAIKAQQVAGSSAEYELVHTSSDDHFVFPALVLDVRHGAPLDGLFTLEARLKIIAPGITFGEALPIAEGYRGGYLGGY